MKQVLMTGSSGFLGRHLQQKLKQQGVHVLALDSKQADLRSDKALLQAVPDPASFDHIFHLAAWTQAGTFCDTHRGIQWIVNQQINTNMIAWWQQYAPQAKLITLGTSVSYAPSQELVETAYMDGQPYDKFYAYAMCKRMLLSGLQCQHRQYGLNYLYLVPSTLYGPGYHTDGRQMHFIYDLIRKILRGKLYGEPVVLWGDGEQRRELVYVDDFVEAMLQLNKLASNDVINLGGGMDYSIKDFAALICACTGYDAANIQYDTTQYVGARSKILQIEKCKSILGEEALHKTSLQEGIQKTIDWMLEEKSVFLS